MKKLIISLSLALSFTTHAYANYCTGIRGNGELAPAHWGSLAKMVENNGLPSVVAGGSSAAITMFMLDGISRNTSLQNKENSITNLNQSLMIKALVPHFMYLYTVDAKSPLIMDVVSDFTGLGESKFFGKLKFALKVAKNLRTFLGILGDYGRILNPELVYGLRKNFKFTKGQIEEGLSVFGSFDAKGDKNIFYRKGIVDFHRLGLIFGRIADFNAGFGKKKVNQKISSFTKTCAPISFGKQWSEIIASNPECKDLLYSALDEYYKPKKKRKRKRYFPNRMIFEKVGSGLKAFPTTSLVQGDAQKRYTKLSQEYIAKEATDITDFSLDFDKELRYGYWGSEEGLNKIEKGIKKNFSSDTKSSKFTKLSGGSWFEVIATSPAEPGLSSLQRIPDGRTLDKKRILKKNYFRRWLNDKKPKRNRFDYRQGYYSAGGWSDLHPTLVLKAYGCEKVFYITRQGGESVFGQQIFIRLTGYTDKISFWKEIKERNRVGFTNLTSVEEASPWNKLYNLANPNSSFNLSIKNADGVYCTDWDKFNVFAGEIDKTLLDAYNAPLFLKDEADRDQFPYGLDSAGKSPDNFPGCILK